MPDYRNTALGLLLPLGVTAGLWVLLFTIAVPWVGGLPPAPEGGLGNPVYYLVKGSILWVPLGFVFALAGRAASLWRWVLCGVVTFLPASLLADPALGLSDYLEALFALVGVWAGSWIGGRVEYPRSEPPAVPQVAPMADASGAFSLAWLNLPLALALLGGAAWGLWEFPRWQIALGVGLALYFVLLLRFRHAWLFVIPAVLPTLHLAPWTGRLSLDEFDLVMLVTLSAALYRGAHPDSRPLAPRPIARLLGGYALVCAAAFVIGLQPFPALEINSFDNYFSGFNSWNVGKGFLWGFLLLGLVRWTLPGGSDLPARLFVPGLLAGSLVVGLVGLRERWQFADLVDFSVPYRITATFSSMHTGGAHLDAWLALLVPLIGYWVVRNRRPWALAVGLGLFLLSVYLVISTVTRTTLVVLMLELGLLTLLWFRGRAGSRGRGRFGLIAALLLAVGALPLLYLGAGGSYFQQRLSAVERDIGVRLDHWGRALRMMDDGFAAQALGMGFGRFPAVYLERGAGGPLPGRYRFETQGGNTHLVLLPGETLYLAQKVPVSDHRRYRLAMDLRSPAAKASVGAPLCEKHLLNSRRCRWMSHSFDGGDGQWRRWEVEFDSEAVGAGSWPRRAPVELSLYNPNERTAVAIDNVSLLDERGKELLRNGNFERGGDFWFLKTHEHLPWHVKNLWVSALFEQGWLGATLLTFLLFALLVYLAGPAWTSGNPAAIAVLTGIVGFGATGLFASPFDAPRITLLLFAVIAFGLYETQAGAVRVRHGRMPDGRVGGTKSPVADSGG